MTTEKDWFDEMDRIAIEDDEIEDDRFWQAPGLPTVSEACGEMFCAYLPGIGCRPCEPEPEPDRQAYDYGE